MTDESDNEHAIVAKYNELFCKIINEESTVVLYPYSTSSSAVPVVVMARMSNIYTDLKRYVLSLNPSIENSDIACYQLYVGTNTTFDDWKSNFLEWTKDKGQRIWSISEVRSGRTDYTIGLPSLYTQDVERSMVPGYS